MKILSLDPATKCGWAYFDGKLTHCGTWNFKTYSDESGGMWLLRFRSHLREFLNAHGVDLIVHEKVTAGGAAKSSQTVMAKLNGLVSVIQMEVEMRHAVEYKGVQLNQVKIHATGKGNAGKEKMLEAARVRWPELEIDDDNAADALWILDYAMEAWGN